MSEETIDDLARLINQANAAGYDEGKSEGYDLGHDDGYAKGWDDATERCHESA